MDHKDGKAPNLEELDGCVAKLIDLFPVGQESIPPRRSGHSMVVHAANRTGKEVLKGNLDQWAYDLRPPALDFSSPVDDLPF